MTVNNNRVTVIGTLSVVALAILAVFITTADNVQAVDGPSRSQPMVCDRLDRVVYFPNFVTAHAWLEQIRWDESGLYSIAMKFEAGKNIALSYQCAKA